MDIHARLHALAFSVFVGIANSVRVWNRGRIVQLCVLVLCDASVEVPCPAETFDACVGICPSTPPAALNACRGICAARCNKEKDQASVLFLSVDNKGI